MSLKMTPLRLAVALALAGCVGAAQAQSNKDTDTLQNYLVDVSAGPVAAADLVGASGTAIGNMQTAQDLVLAIQPFSSRDAKGGFGIAMTPARTPLTPMSGQRYVSNDLYRLLGALTISYAETSATIGEASYKKSAFSLDTTYYLHLEDDPVMIGYRAFTGCSGRKAIQAQMADDAQRGDNEAFKQHAAQAEAADKDCQQTAQNGARWNASRIALSYGAGRIEPDSGATHQSLGRTLALSGVFGVGQDSAVYVAARRTVDELDLSTLAATPAFSSSSLVALRVTSGSSGNGALRWLAEVSNAGASASGTAYRYAVGLDKKVLDGLWLQFRYGKSRTADGTTSMNKGLLNLSWSPGSTLFQK
jgi:hypothetical protein